MKKFLFNKFLLMLGFKRSEKISLSNEVVEDSFKLLQEISWDDSFLSPVWKKVFLKFGKTSLNEAKKEIDINALKESYEEFFVNGLSDGACVGADLMRFRSAMKYAVRGNNRLKLLNKHFDFTDGQSKPLDSIKSSNEMLSGQPWLQKIEGNWINPEIIDHLYFFEICKNLPIPKDDILFIGEGSGILSNIFMSNCDVANATFIDLPHFLIRQHITNHNLNNIKRDYLTPDQLYKLSNNNGRRVLINQDSFPEIPSKYLNEYFDLIDSGLVTDVFSYNKKDSSFGHANFREILLSKNIKCLLSIESVMRPGYFIEWYSANNG